MRPTDESSQVVSPFKGCPKEKKVSQKSVVFLRPVNFTLKFLRLVRSRKVNLLVNGSRNKFVWWLRFWVLSLPLESLSHILVCPAGQVLPIFQLPVAFPLAILAKVLFPWFDLLTSCRSMIGTNDNLICFTEGDEHIIGKFMCRPNGILTHLSPCQRITHIEPIEYATVNEGRVPWGPRIPVPRFLLSCISPSCGL